MAKQQIKEEMGIQKEWYKTAKGPEMSLETLPQFLTMLTEDFSHDYGTICHVLAAGAVATATALNRSPEGGITGFQAGAVMWEFIKNWGMGHDGPMRLVDFEDMLFPQYEEKFRTISKETWEYLQKEAQKNLDSENTAIPEIEAHWKSIVNGQVPFGYELEIER